MSFKRTLNLHLVPFLAILAVIVTAVVGWVLNIIALVQTGGEAPLGLLIARVVGIFVAPLGAVLGLFF